jgi:pullulanase
MTTVKQEVDAVVPVQTAKAHWVSRDTIAWIGAEPNGTYRLYHSPTGQITAQMADGVLAGPFVPLAVDTNGLPRLVVEKFPFLKDATALKISERDWAQIPGLLKGELVLAKMDNAASAEATTLLLAGVLDDLFYFDGELGAQQSGDEIRFRLWAPTARSVRLFVHDAPDDAADEIYPMVEGEVGVWEVQVGDSSWLNRKYYVYEVQVFWRPHAQMVTNLVTDPYSFGLAPNSAKSLVVDFNSPLSKPDSWNLIPKPELASPTDIVLYELHIRDFSISDQTVPEKDRGKYTGFTHIFSNGMLHLWGLAAAGLTHVHLLPAFDFTSVPESAAEQKLPQIDPTNLEPASTEAQAAIALVKDQDGYNWGYDPYHYGSPEGSYSTNPSGITRIREFRAMVESLHLIGLRVVMDVVYTHTAAAGQDFHSVLDKVVPGYYYRLDRNGDFYTSTCCPNTASEHRMFFKLMLDTLKVWVKEYRVDGFRFDLMGFSFKSNLLEIQKALHEIDPTLYLYGEGWDFGEVANNALGENASQANMAGTGIGTFSDRGRDAMRGGRAFDRGRGLVANQGFLNGLWYDRNDFGDGTLEQLLEASDLVKLALAGTGKEYQWMDHHGALVTGAQLRYSGRPAGYSRDPSEVINYVSAHDNQTLFDNNQYKLPIGTGMSDRVRVNNLALALVGLAQGIPFFHAGDDLLRSKSFDRNSYNSGDWFNRLDWTYQTNNFAVGLPPSWDNQEDWPLIRLFLQNRAIKPGFDQIYASHLYFKDILRIRKSTPLFRLRTGVEIRERVKFYNAGADQQPALIVMAILDRQKPTLDPEVKSVVVFFNVDKIQKVMTLGDYVGVPLELHPVLRRSFTDLAVTRVRYESWSGSFIIPPRTTAVFVERR